MKTHPAVSLFMLLAVVVFFVCTVRVKDQEIPYGAFVAESNYTISGQKRLSGVYTKYVVNGVAHKMTKDVAIVIGDKVQLLKVVQPGWKKVVFIALLISLIMMIGIGLCTQEQLMESARAKARIDMSEEALEQLGYSSKPKMQELELSTD